MKNFISILRKLEHKKLASLGLRGKVLDLGGSKTSYYYKLIKNDNNDVVVLNIDPGARPDIFADLEDKLPIKDLSFDAVLAVNVLEHIYQYQNLIRESHRVLKPGGVFIGVVPFLFNIHPSPHDYFRYTADALKNIFKNSGFTDIRVETLGCGVMGSRFFLLQNFLPNFLHPVFEKISIAEDKFLYFIAKKLGKQYNPDNYPLGYFFTAKKP